MLIASSLRNFACSIKSFCRGTYELAAMVTSVLKPSQLFLCAQLYERPSSSRSTTISTTTRIIVLSELVAHLATRVSSPKLASINKPWIAVDFDDTIIQFCLV